MFMVATFLEGSLLGVSSFLRVTNKETLIPMVIAYLFSLMILAFYLKLMSLNPGKNLIEINEIVFGKILGKLVSALYAFYFFSLLVTNTQEVGYFFINYIMAETPFAIIVALFIFVCILAARKGVDSIAKYGGLFTIAQAIVTIMLTGFAIKDIKLASFLPIFEAGLKEYVQSTHIISSLAFLDTLALLMIVPNPANQKKNNKGFFLGFTIAMALLFVIMFSVIGVMGPVLSYLALARFETARYINVFDIFSRMETLFALLITMLRFYKVSILLYASSLALAQTCGLRSYVPLVSVMGALAASASIFVFRSIAESSSWIIDTAPFYSTLFQVVLPLLTLGICLIRARFKKQQSG